ncbi:hypothetical protein TRIUR3_05130 [Triticum urartu]|uniref:Uncharacterized protein n=2 Tax=Triticum TaxID=4564 RepID=A0A9R0Z5A0_TRITD|nr:hypothetical protein TRIUR3_05130 [Triticum urartu]VAI70643.1 unnamed protein product [Triticum turgidum subsp. durum]
MEASGSQQEEPRRLSSGDHESLKDTKNRKGGWITFPFLAVAILCLGLATAGAMSNMVVYLITEYHVPSVDAAQISTIIAGSISVAPVAGAIVADAFFGCYPIVAVAMATSVLGSPFTGLARVVVAAARKRKVGVVAPGELKFYHGLRREDDDGKTGGDGVLPPSDSFR